MYSQCLACERGIQIPRDHMFPFAHSCTSLASIIRKSDLFYTCCGSADNIHDYPSHVSCFSERRGQYVWVHMCTCSSMCVERNRKGGKGVLFGTEGRPPAYLWFLSVGSTHCFSDRTQMLSFCLAIHPKEAVNGEAFHLRGLILTLPSPAFSNLKICKFSYLYLML